jgi:hypothetical protein
MRIAHVARFFALVGAAIARRAGGAARLRFLSLAPPSASPAQAGVAANRRPRVIGRARASPVSERFDVTVGAQGERSLRAQTVRTGDAE